MTEFETRKTVQTESRTKPIGLSLAEVQPVFGETKATKQIAHYDTPPGYFGHLTLLPDGKVYADCSAAPLGSMEDSITQMIVKELEGTRAWRYIRDSAECRECLYRYLCPSPRFYERMMGLDCILS